MDNILVRAKDGLGKSFFILKNELRRLIEEGRIRQFHRVDGWVDAAGDPRKRSANEYRGRERRASAKMDWALLSRPVEEQLRGGNSLEAILGYGRKAREIAAKLKSVAATKLSVLLQGNTGTGKGVAAEILHELSRRKDRRLVKVDCGAIPPTLIESELFGHEKGSFTGAFRSKPGRFQMADRGTILLDEISNLSMDMQARLLGFLEERMVNSIGGVNPIRLDVRVVSASNIDLEEEIRKGRFRQDLYYRLSEFQIRLPSLKDRPDDFFYLAGKFLAMAAAELGKRVFGLSEEAMDFLAACEWKGNIRELKNVMRRAALLASEVIEVEHLNGFNPGGRAEASLDFRMESAFLKGCSLPEICETVRKAAEQSIIRRVYDQTDKNKMKTSAAIGIDYSTLHRKMKEYAIP